MIVGELFRELWTGLTCWVLSNLGVTFYDCLYDSASVSGFLWFLLGFQCCGGPGSTAEAEDRKAGVSECPEPGGLLNWKIQK